MNAHSNSLLHELRKDSSLSWPNIFNEMNDVSGSARHYNVVDLKREVLSILGLGFNDDKASLPGNTNNLGISEKISTSIEKPLPKGLGVKMHSSHDGSLRKKRLANDAG